MLFLASHAFHRAVIPFGFVDQSINHATDQVPPSADPRSAPEQELRGLLIHANKTTVQFTGCKNNRLRHTITMSALDILSTLNILIKLGSEIQTRLDSLNQAVEDLQLLNTNLKLLCRLFESPMNEDIIKTHGSEFVNIADVLQSITHSCTKCAKALNIDLAGATLASKTEARGKKFVKRIWAFNKIPDLLAEIQRKAEQLQQVYSAVSAVILHDIRMQQERTSGKETVEATAVVQKANMHENLLNLDLSTDFVNINQMVGNLMKECKYLRQRLQEATLFPDTSAVQERQAQNPEAASFWKDRFQKNELYASALRYEVRALKTSPLFSFFVANIAASY